MPFVYQQASQRIQSQSLWEAQSQRSVVATGKAFTHLFPAPASTAPLISRVRNLPRGPLTTPYPHSDLIEKPGSTAGWLANCSPETGRMVLHIQDSIQWMELSSSLQILGLPPISFLLLSHCKHLACSLTPHLQVTQHLPAAFFGHQVQTILELASPIICNCTPR